MSVMQFLTASCSVSSCVMVFSPWTVRGTYPIRSNALPQLRSHQKIGDESIERWYRSAPRYQSTRRTAFNNAGLKSPNGARLFLRLHERTDERRNFLCLRIEREVADIEHVKFGIRDVLAVAFRRCGQMVEPTLYGNKHFRPICYQRCPS
jgi:hypothetical protein